MEYCAFLSHDLKMGIKIMEKQVAKLLTEVVDEIIIKIDECIGKLKKISSPYNDDTNNIDEISITKISEHLLSDDFVKCIE